MQEPIEVYNLYNIGLKEAFIVKVVKGSIRLSSKKQNFKSS